MKKRTKLAMGAGAALAVVGAGGAVAATKLSPRDESKAVVEDAAKQLGVDPTKLSDALKQALENRVDEAVKAGRLTEEQGQAMKQRIETDDFPLFAGPAFGGHRGFGHRGFRDLDAAAAFLGVDEKALRDRLRDGETLAEVAKAERKSVDGLVTAIVDATSKRLDAAVTAGKLTKAQRETVVSGLKERTTQIVNGIFPAFKGREGSGMRGGPGFGFRGPGHGPGDGDQPELPDAA
ncbi:MAG: hypothetical protein ABIR67_02875 [Gaiellaceae bacterium]